MSPAPAIALSRRTPAARAKSWHRASIQAFATSSPNGSNDPRPVEERRTALFDFMYETYDASAWIPQSLFDSNLITQAVIGDLQTIVGEKVGLVLWRDNPQVPAFGMAPNAREQNAPLRWTVNCLVCHMAEIDGRVYLGAGTKTFDELWLGDALKQLAATGGVAG